MDIKEQEIQECKNEIENLWIQINDERELAEKDLKSKDETLAQR